MNIEDNKERMVFRNDYNGKALYSISLSKQNQNKEWENGTINCRFPKNADIPNKTKIKIVNGWLDFYVKDKVTHPYLFINKYEIVTENKQEPSEEVNEFSAMSINTNYQSNDIKISDADLPF